MDAWERRKSDPEKTLDAAFRHLRMEGMFVSQGSLGETAGPQGRNITCALADKLGKV